LRFVPTLSAVDYCNSNLLSLLSFVKPKGHTGYPCCRQYLFLWSVTLLWDWNQ